MNGNRRRVGTGTAEMVSVAGLVTDESSSRLVPGKNVRKTRCVTCRALVIESSLDQAGQCDSCTVQRGLFAVKPWRRRKSRMGGGRHGQR